MVGIIASMVIGRFVGSCVAVVVGSTEGVTDGIVVIFDVIGKESDGMRVGVLVIGVEVVGDDVGLIDGLDDG